MKELVNYLSNGPNGFAEIYLTQITFSSDTLDRLNSLSDFVQINSTSTSKDIKEIIFDVYPQLQTTPENHKDVDKILQKKRL